MMSDSEAEKSAVVEEAAALGWPHAEFDVYKATELRDLLKVLASTVEEAPFLMGYDGLSVLAMDPSHVAMIDMVVPSEFFDRYDVTREGVFCFSVEEVLRVVFRKVLKDTSLRVVVEEEERALFELFGDGLTRRKFIPLLEPFDAEVPKPKLVHRCSVRIVAKAFRRIVEDFSVSEHLAIVVDGDRVVFSSSGDMGREETPLEAADQNVLGIACHEGPQKSTYTMSYLRDVVKMIPAVADVVELRFSEGMPLEIVFELKIAGRLSWWLAPCIGV